MTQINYVCTVYERNAWVFICVTKPAIQPAKWPTNQPTNQTNKESYMGRDRHSTNEVLSTSEETDGSLLFSNQVEIGPYSEALKLTFLIQILLLSFYVCVQISQAAYSFHGFWLFCTFEVYVLSRGLFLSN
jgi:hypothetical protein